MSNLAYTCFLNVCIFTHLLMATTLPPHSGQQDIKNAVDKGLETVSTINQVVLAIIMLVSGFLLCFFGGKKPKILLFFLIFVLATLAVYLVLTDVAWFHDNLRAESYIVLLIATGVGLVIAIIATVFFQLAVFAVGAGLGFLVGNMLFKMFAGHWDAKAARYVNVAMVAVMCIVFGVIVWKFFESLVKIITAFIGSFFFSLAIGYFIELARKSGINPMLRFFDIRSKGEVEQEFKRLSDCSAVCIMYIAFFVIMFLLGLIYQYRWHKCGKEEDSSNDKLLSGGDTYAQV